MRNHDKQARAKQDGDSSTDEAEPSRADRDVATVVASSRMQSSAQAPTSDQTDADSANRVQPVPPAPLKTEDNDAMDITDVSEMFNPSKPA